MGILNKGTDFQAGDTVTATSLNELVENATFDNGSNQATDNSSLAVHSSGYLEVKDGGVTLGKMANLAANSVIGNNTGSTATPSAVAISSLHPTGDGNLHVPATGTTNSGKVLTAGSTAGSFSWQSPSSGGAFQLLQNTHSNSTSGGSISLATYGASSFGGTWTGSGNPEDAISIDLETKRFGNFSFTSGRWLGGSLGSGSLTVRHNDALIINDALYHSPVLSNGASSGFGASYNISKLRSIVPVIYTISNTQKIIGYAENSIVGDGLPNNSGNFLTMRIWIGFTGTHTLSSAGYMKFGDLMLLTDA
jgi:hypothetical protein